MDRDTLTFDAALHQYRLGEREVPSVTQVIDAVLPGWHASEWHKLRGTAVHRACQLLDERRLEWSSVDPQIKGRLQAWTKFLADARASILGVEMQLGSVAFQFAGTLDRLLQIDGDVVLADIKGTIEPQVELQLGGYSLLCPKHKKPVRAVAVQLGDDERYKTRWLPKRQLRLAENAFLATLTVFNFMKANGIKGDRR